MKISDVIHVSLLLDKSSLYFLLLIVLNFASTTLTTYHFLVASLRATCDPFSTPCFFQKALLLLLFLVLTTLNRQFIENTPQFTRDTTQDFDSLCIVDILLD